MENGKDILDKIGKPSVGVPEGYFSDLKARLETIPSSGTVRLGAWTRVKPYLSLAASFAVILIIGESLLRHTTKARVEDQITSESSFVELISLTRPEAFYDVIGIEDADSEVSDDISDEDIINYLIQSGVRTEQLAYAGEL